MTKEQLFGKESEPLYTSMFFACIGTVVFWIIFTLVMIFVKPVKKIPEYKTVQIVLESTPVVEKKVEMPHEKSEPEPLEKTVIQQKIEPEKTEPQIIEPVKVPEVKQETVKSVEKTKANDQPKIVEKTKTEAAKTAEPKIVKEKQPEPTFTGEYVDPMEAFETQVSKKTKKSADDIWNSMNDDFVEVQQNQTENYVKPNLVKNSFEGNAGEKATTEVEQELPKVTEKTAATNETSNSLKGIASATAAPVAESSETAKKLTKGAKISSDSDSEIKFMFGPNRKVISKTEISISPENQNKVTGDTLRVSFDVNENGNVIRNSIIIKPSQSTSVIEEIADQVSKWIFSPGEETVTATFNLKIIRN